MSSINRGIMRLTVQAPDALYDKAPHLRPTGGSHDYFSASPPTTRSHE
jgi:hypothetical protein